MYHDLLQITVNRQVQMLSSTALLSSIANVFIEDLEQDRHKGAIRDAGRESIVSELLHFVHNMSISLSFHKPEAIKR